jgi:hypothetical protein
LSDRFGEIVPRCRDRLRSFAAALRRVSLHRHQAGSVHAPATVFEPSTGGYAQVPDDALKTVNGW